MQATDKFALPPLFILSDITTLCHTFGNTEIFHSFYSRAAITLSMLFSQHVNDVLFSRSMTREGIMAKFRESTFAVLTLDASQEKDFTAWVSKNKPAAIDCMTELLGEGFKVSVTWVVDSNSFCFSLIGTDVTKKHTSMVMTSWSDDLIEVILIAYYKHVVVCDRQEWPSGRTGTRWG